MQTVCRIVTRLVEISPISSLAQLKIEQTYQNTVKSLQNEQTFVRATLDCRWLF